MLKKGETGKGKWVEREGGVERKNGKREEEEDGKQKRVDSPCSGSCNTQFQFKEIFSCVPEKLPQLPFFPTTAAPQQTNPAPNHNFTLTAKVTQ